MIVGGAQFLLPLKVRLKSFMSVISFVLSLERITADQVTVTGAIHECSDSGEGRLDFVLEIGCSTIVHFTSSHHIYLTHERQNESRDATLRIRAVVLQVCQQGQNECADNALFSKTRHLLYAGRCNNRQPFALLTRNTTRRSCRGSC